VEGLSPQFVAQLVGMFVTVLVVISLLAEEGKLHVELSPVALRWFSFAAALTALLWLAPRELWSWNFIQFVLYLADPTPDPFRFLLVSVIGLLLYVGIFAVSWLIATLFTRRSSQ
jgi:hypothetical protein